MSLDRRAIVDRHKITLSAADPSVVLSVGNGDFGFSTDVTGLQTFVEYHQPDPQLAFDPAYGRVTNACTMSNWGWDEEENVENYSLEDASSEYETPRGPVPYPDHPSVEALRTGVHEKADRAGMWFVENPRRVDLGRLGLVLRPAPDAAAETDPGVLTHLSVELDMWTGAITSRFRYLGAPVEVITAAAPTRAMVATRIVSPLLATGQLGAVIRFGASSTHFALPVDWANDDRHRSELTRSGTGRVRIDRKLATTHYSVDLQSGDGDWRQVGPHRFEITTKQPSLEICADFVAGSGPGAELYEDDGRAPAGPAEVLRDSARFWEEFWESGAAVDFAGSSHDRATELERRIVLSQYLTRVHGGGVIPPQETGFVTNSWLGKFHLEMHWWHAAHFAAWGRPELLERSLGWYETIHDRARATARHQGYRGARWPKQVGPNGIESPSDVGSLLVWQQPHLLYFAELLWRAHAASPVKQEALVRRFAPLLDDTAEFMVDFADERDGVFHLGAPVMPAQEFYKATTTSDPTFELAYWAFALEVAQLFRERRGLARHPEWERVRSNMAEPTMTDGRYSAVADEPSTRTDDHPSMLLAFGFVPPTTLVDADIARRTLDWVLDNWEWATAWGWDFPALAMTAARLGSPETALDLLLRDALKNQYDEAGHNPQMGSFLPVYLPGNGGLLSAISLLFADADGVDSVSYDNGWRIRHEGFTPWP